MIVGYARTSTTDQQAGLNAQLRDLEAAGVERVFGEQTSAVGQRPQSAMDHLRGPDAPGWHLLRVLTLPMHDGLIVPVSAVERAVEDLFAAGLILGKVRLNLKVSRADGSVEYLRSPPQDARGGGSLPFPTGVI